MKYINPSLLYSPTAGWTDSQPIPVPTMAHCQVTSGDTTFIIGGVQDQGNWGPQLGKTGATYRSINEGPWEEVMPLQKPRQDHACVEWNKKIIAIGGVDKNNDLLSSIESYDTLTNKWTSLTPLPKPMLSMQAVVYKGSLYVLGGMSQRGWNKEVYQLRPGGRAWELVSGASVDIRGRGVFPAVVFNNLHCRK